MKSGPGARIFRGGQSILLHPSDVQNGGRGVRVTGLMSGGGGEIGSQV